MDVNVTSAAAAMMEYTITSGNHTSKNANGNIITLTLKNNHLIVETEERAVRMLPLEILLVAYYRCNAIGFFNVSRHANVPQRM